jgi:membrane fusion protein, multidrug efflux system
MPDNEHSSSPESEDESTEERKERSQDDKKDAQDEKGKDEQPPHKRSRWPLIALIIAVIVAIIAGVIYWLMTKDQESTDDAYVDGRAIMVAPQVSGPVMQLAVNDNQFVHTGDLLVEIDRRPFQASYDQAAGNVAAITAQLGNARIALDKERTIAPAALLQARGQLAQAQGQLFQAQADNERQRKVERAATSQQDIDRATAGLRQAQGQVDQALAQVKQADLIPQNVAQAEAQVAQLEGQLAQAQASLAQAALNLGYTRVLAPQDGWITRRNVEVGTYIQTGTQILAIVSPEVWVTANFKENQLNRMRSGQAVDITVDSYPALKLHGHVDSIQLGSGSRFSAFPAENATGNFVKIVQRMPVKIVIDSGLDPNLPLPLGASVEPTVSFK